MPVLAEIKHEIPIPEGVTVTVDHENNENHTVIKGPKGELERRFRFRGVRVDVEDGHVTVHKDLPRREHKAICGTYAAHIRNMLHGVTEGWKYELKTVYNHFPIKASVQGETFLIENFLGERHPRKAAILGGAKVQVKGQDVVVEGIDRQTVSQTAANIEQATRIRGRDIRVFQDGIYITNKGVA
ncbi:MAG: 50S ribosomal protein L6 [Thermoplasmatota archaeon]